MAHSRGHAAEPASDYRAYRESLKPRPATGAKAPRAVRWAVIEPDMLPGEDVLFVMDRANLQEAQAANPGLVTYLLEEMDLLPPASDVGSLKMIHALKRKFGGWMVPAQKFHA